MSCIVYQTDKRTGIKYAYESVSYWDKDKKQPRSKRKYLGRVDPETGEILTSQNKKNSCTDSASGPLIARLQAEITEKDSQIEMLQKELEALSATYKKTKKLIGKIASLAAELTGETDVK